MSMLGIDDEWQDNAAGEGAANAEHTPNQKMKGKKKEKATSEKKDSTAKKCCVPHCEESKHGKARFCKMHERSAGGLTYQIDHTNDEEVTGPFYEGWPDDNWAGREVHKFCLENPPEKKYARKKLISTAQYKKVRGSFFLGRVGGGG